MRRRKLVGLGTLAVVAALGAACGGKTVGVPTPGGDDCGGQYGRCAPPEPTNDFPYDPQYPEPTPMPPPTGTAAPKPPVDSLEPPPGLPPSHDVPCSAGAAVELSFAITSANMSSGASDKSGTGFCYGTVQFKSNLSQRDDISYPDYKNGDYAIVHAESNGMSLCPSPKPPGTFHCSTLRYGDGHITPSYCTIFALCENGVARSTGFTW